MKIVQGIEVSGYGDQGLAEDLDSYCQISPAAMSHLRKAQQAGARIETQRAGNICHAAGATVKVSMDACVDPASGMTSRPYLTESVLFELHNAINAKRYGALRTDVKGGRISILQYGLAMAKLEFESTEKIVQILTQIKGAGHPLSPWGQKQFSGYAKGAQSAANQPHDPNSAGAQRMPSKLFYAYSYLTDEVQHVRNMKVQVLQKVATIRHGAKSMDKFIWSQMRQNWGTKYAAKTPAQFLVAYIDALQWLDNEVGWSVMWEGGTKADWKLCATEFVKTVAAVQHDADLSKRLKTEIMAARFV